MNRRNVLVSAFGFIASLAGLGFVKASRVGAESPVSGRVRPGEPLPIELDRATIARAREWLDRITRGDIDRRQLDPITSRLFTADAAKSVAEDIARLGRPTAMYPLETRITAEGTANYYRVSYPSQTLTWTLSRRSDGAIQGFALLRRKRDAVVSIYAVHSDTV